MSLNFERMTSNLQINIDYTPVDTGVVGIRVIDNIMDVRVVGSVCEVGPRGGDGETS